MIAMLRNLAANWADQRYVKANHALRRGLIAAQAQVGMLRQERAHLRNALRSYGQIAQANAEMRKQAEEDRDAALTQMHEMEAERDQAWARLTELEQPLVAASGKQGPPDDGWAGVVAAGLGTPDVKPQCPEGLLLDEVELHRCVRDGGHEGDHWSRDHKRQWPQVEVDENCEVPW